ncbi:hypothetical protein [Leptolyngbya sp. FACHB-711]|uniref:hypothetical protein n=1 Tax=unclassified Leptolyngbya TaxID=2650499 RepID=UPI0016841483|nr:hypothetical protein [Leptolyngbya sp. FACHB-711]MBD1849169.1 hypothetical protein [Cyanobacteria bacterium FACHB-502]MBD2026684.1 hypothetical protein [Leptolyngbya sp. FACHB-711]
MTDSLNNSARQTAIQASLQPPTESLTDVGIVLQWADGLCFPTGHWSRFNVGSELLFAASQLQENQAVPYAIVTTLAPIYPINQLTNQSTNQSTNQQIDQLIDQLIDRSIHQQALQARFQRPIPKSIDARAVIPPILDLICSSPLPQSN